MNSDIKIIAETINLPDLQKELAMPKPNQMLIDVRTEEEYALGHIPGFVNFPMDEIDQYMGEFSKKDIILSCQSGVRCRKVADLMSQEGHVNSVKEFSGGFKAWEGADLPIESDTSSAHARVEKEYHPKPEHLKLHNGDNALSKVKTNISRAAGTVSHQVFDQAKETLGNIEGKFVALPPLRQVYAILGGLILLSAIISGVIGVLLSLLIAVALIFSAVTGIMFMTDWIAKAPWNRKK